MTPRGIIGQLLTALSKIAEADQALGATSSHDWRRRVKIVAGNAIEQANKDLRRNYVRYCFECGHVGEVGKEHRDCCPDGSHAVYVPQEVAEQARIGFRAQLVEIKDRDITNG
jgi:hypothetical protein